MSELLQTRPSEASAPDFPDRRWLRQARAIAVFHGVLVLTVYAGTAALLAGTFGAWPLWGKSLYALALGSVILSQIAIKECLLTRWEKQCRERYAPGSAYPGSFVARYCPPLHTGQPAAYVLRQAAVIGSLALLFRLWAWLF